MVHISSISVFQELCWNKKIFVTLKNNSKTLFGWSWSGKCLKYLVKNQQFEPVLGILELQKPFEEHRNEWSGLLNEDPDHHQRVFTLLLHKTNSAFQVRSGITSPETHARQANVRGARAKVLRTDLKIRQRLEFLLTHGTAGLKGPRIRDVVSQVVDLELDYTVFIVLFVTAHRLHHRWGRSTGVFVPLWVRSRGWWQAGCRASDFWL